MNVSSYVFQSPYSQQIQVGRPNPNAQSVEEPQQAALQSSVTSPTAEEAQEYMESVASSSAATVNVAGSTADTGVSGSLAEFTTVNSKAQAQEAYAG